MQSEKTLCLTHAPQNKFNMSSHQKKSVFLKTKYNLLHITTDCTMHIEESQQLHFVKSITPKINKHALVYSSIVIISNQYHLGPN